jgi:hypothetical protein
MTTFGDSCRAIAVAFLAFSQSIVLASTISDPVPQVTKSNSLEGSVGIDLTNQMTNITWHQEGTAVGSSLMLDNPNPIMFMLGTGASQQVNNSLAGQRQLSAWNIKGVFANGQTTFVENLPNPSTAHIDSGASVFSVPGSSLARTSFRAGTLTGAATAAKINANASRDDASVITDDISIGTAFGELSFSLNGTVDLDVQTTLRASLGGSASIVSNDPSPSNDGLLLLAAPGQGVSYTVIARDILDPSLSFSWSAIFNGSGSPIVTATGISNPSQFFVSVTGGWFLPFANMPARDLTGTLPAGNLDFSGNSSADVATVPEPRIWPMLLISMALIVRWSGRCHSARCNAQS